MSFTDNSPEPYAIAFGGVLMGRIIATEAENAVMRAITVGVTPMVIAIGKMSAAVDVFDIKVVIITVIKENISINCISDVRPPTSNLPTIHLASPLCCIATPSDNPPPISISISHPSDLKSFLSIIPLPIKAMVGTIAITPEGIPWYCPVSHKPTVIMKTAITHLSLIFKGNNFSILNVIF